MNAIRTFEVYFVEGKIYGHEITHKPYPRSADGFDVSHVLIGKSAAFCIVSSDRSVNRPLAIHFAAAIQNRTFKTFSVDISKVGVQK